MKIIETNIMRVYQLIIGRLGSEIFFDSGLFTTYH